MILITGAAGFIGSNIVAGLNARARSNLAICDYLGHEDKWRNLSKAAFADFVAPDDIERWLAASDKLSAVIHMGAISATTATDGDEVIKTNFNLSLRLLDHCADCGIPFLYASSAAVYGDAEQTFEDRISPAAIRALRPLNLYGWSKRQFDLVVADRLASGRGLPPQCVGFRFFNVFGPNEYHKGDMKSVVAKITPQIERGNTIKLFKSHRPGIQDGDQRRDFVYVRDVVDVILWFLDASGPSGIFNIGTGEARSFRNLAEAVFASLDRPVAIDYIPMPETIRDKYQYFTRASLDNLRQAGYRGAFTSLEDGIRDYVQNYLVKPDPYC